MNEQFNQNNQNSTQYAGGQPQMPSNPPEHHSAEMVALILGIVSWFLMGCCCVNLVLSIISICYALKAKRLAWNHQYSGMALAGMILSILSIVMTVVMYVIFAVIFVLELLVFEATPDGFMSWLYF